MKFNKAVILLLLIHFVYNISNGQNTGILTGVITDRNDEPVEFANITIAGTATGTVSKENGMYTFPIEASQYIKITFSHVSFNPLDTVVYVKPGETMQLNISLESVYQELEEVSVTTQYERGSTLHKIETKDFELLPNASGNFETILKTMGVRSNSELSSQYSVRGGNYDENLVYVNDIEIYRPFLIRSGQQEGLSFVNPDMVSAVQFSAGGFDASYGDKMSSVLDINYKRPNRFEGNVAASLLGGSTYIGGITKNKRFTHSSALRYKTSKYLLGTLETTGEYSPTFVDFQTFMTYSLSPKVEISFLGNYASNQFDFVPETRSTTFGTISNAMNLTVYYEGQEKDLYRTGVGALSVNYNPRDNVVLKFIGSSFITDEQETFDILGQYAINALDNQFGSETLGDSILNLGIGSYLEHARNFISANVNSVEHKGSWNNDNNYLKWGVRYQREIIDFDYHEWTMIDSAGFSIPYSDSEVNLSKFKSGQYLLDRNRYMGYLQNTFSIETSKNTYYLTLGARANFNDLNNEFIFSPRATFSYTPVRYENIVVKVAWGHYAQPTFLKELISIDGTLYKEKRAQQSVHYVLGGDYTFNFADRPFKLTAELYHKSYENLIPYKIDNVRIQYFPEYSATGYATGIEFKLNGEFVKDAPSWISVSFAKTMEDTHNDQYFIDEPAQYFEAAEGLYTIEPAKRYRIEPGYYRRPSDQLFNISMFFQDYFPNNPDYKVHLNFVYGSRMPSSNPNTRRMDQIYTIPSYKRVDIGFSRKIKHFAKPETAGFIENIWISGEIFNMLGVKNTVSYDWIKTVSNSYGSPGWWGVPNFLTSRRINVKLIVNFH